MAGPRYAPEKFHWFDAETAGELFYINEGDILLAPFDPAYVVGMETAQFREFFL